MDTAFLKRLRWEHARLLSIFGWPGMAGLVLLAGCAWFYATALLPAELRYAQLRDGLLEREQARAEVREGFAKSGDPRAQLAAFYRFFESDEAPQGRLAALAAAAESAGANIRRAEYRFLDDSGQGLRRYRIVIPMTGTYGQIRRFVAAVLRSLPTASVDSLSFQRRRVAESAVEAEITLTLYFLERA